jgi:hypothetical protein
MSNKRKQYRLLQRKLKKINKNKNTHDNNHQVTFEKISDNNIQQNIETNIETNIFFDNMISNYQDIISVSLIVLQYIFLNLGFYFPFTFFIYLTYLTNLINIAVLSKTNNHILIVIHYLSTLLTITIISFKISILSGITTLSFVFYNLLKREDYFTLDGMKLVLSFLSYICHPILFVFLAGIINYL